ncbi:hypothetical protein MKW98_016812 [Papaver atlanticum]|uniref:Peptidase S9 prolyl oligopeptidase catalytic domain-containing protein n=1 Tax=Papaver atlanticum TaxID=357466 RepID=A0AAD4TGT2_9MAGN|nr:hypothetical protein MKW98_016812 [Papaver atlanticum]
MKLFLKSQDYRVKVQSLRRTTFILTHLNSLKIDTHKFESHYTDNFVGCEEAYFERSPIYFVDKFSCLVILFQGLEDKVVTSDQARKIYTALKQKGLPVALVEYEGEQHGLAASSLVVLFEIDGLNWDSWLSWLQLKEVMLSWFRTRRVLWLEVVDCTYSYIVVGSRICFNICQGNFKEVRICFFISLFIFSLSLWCLVGL